MISSADSASRITPTSCSRIAGSFTHSPLRLAPVGRGLTGIGPGGRFCGTGGLDGLPLKVSMKPTSEPYM